MNILAYDFGYGWAWNYGHLIGVGGFGLLALIGWKLGWPRWVTAISSALAVWAVVGFLIVQFVFRMNLPMELPTENFLTSGVGEVLDAGAGSGRSTIMVLQARPQARVSAIDLYQGYFGIPDNTPNRLLKNAVIAGVEDRVRVRVGDMREIPAEAESFDAAVSAFAIDHLGREDAKTALAEVQRVLRPNGEFLLIVINPDIWTRVAFPFFVHHGYFGGRTHHERWRSDVIGAGFEVSEMGTQPSALFILARKPAVVPDPPSSAG